MGFIKILDQSVDEESSTARHPVGSEYEDYHATMGHRKFVYAQASGACTAGAPQALLSYGQVGQVAGVTQRGCPPLVPLCAVTDDYYAWFQYEGVIDEGRALAGDQFDTIQTGYELMVYATYFVHGTVLTGYWIGFAVAEEAHPYQATSYITNTLRIFLRGGLGGGRVAAVI